MGFAKEHFPLISDLLPIMDYFASILDYLHLVFILLLRKHGELESQFKVLPGEAGSVFAGDTKCWHKGMPLTKGNRLLLEFEYSSNSFGVNIPEMRITNSNTKFIDFCKENPVFSSRIKY